MKMFKFGFIALTLALATAANATSRKIELHGEMIDGVAHWVPAKVEVTQGETVSFVVKNTFATGFAFHGFKIPALNIESQVDRDKTATIEKKIELAPGEYPILCHFHPKHAHSVLIVKAAGK